MTTRREMEQDAVMRRIATALERIADTLDPRDYHVARTESGGADTGDGVTADPGTADGPENR